MHRPPSGARPLPLSPHPLTLTLLTCERTRTHAQVGALIAELNELLSDDGAAFDPSKLSAKCRAVFDLLPEAIRARLGIGMRVVA